MSVLNNYSYPVDDYNYTLIAVAELKNLHLALEEAKAIILPLTNDDFRITRIDAAKAWAKKWVRE